MSEYFLIDVNTRIITVPTTFVNIGVKSDHNAIKLYFQIDRVYSGEDLSTHNIAIQYINGNAEKDIYSVTEIDLSVADKIIFAWKISNHVTKYQGKVLFSIRFYSVVDGVYTYSYNTQIASFTVLDGITVALSEINTYKDILSSVPTKTSQLMNDSGFITAENDPTIPSWAKQTTKPAYTAVEVGALPNTTFIPTKISELTDDGNFVHKSNNETIEGMKTFSGNVFAPNLLGGDTMYGGTIIDNFDIISKNGFYTGYGTSMGAPNSDYSWFLEHQNSNVGTASAMQKAMAYGNNQIVYIRKKHNNSWGLWTLQVSRSEFDSVISGINLSLNTNVVNVISVKNDGSGDYIKLSDAIQSISNSSKSNQYLINIYDGEYDIIQELGGDSFLATITSASNRVGLRVPDYVTIKGIGAVILKGEIQDNSIYATYDVSEAFSTIELYQNNTLENLTITARNTRYAVHDESSNTYQNYERNMKDCKLIHYGNKSGLWTSTRAYGAGAGSGAKYSFINCKFIGADGAGWSIHDNINFNMPLNINIDNCKITNGGHGYDKSALIFSTVSVDSTLLHRVYINNCDIQGYIHQIVESTGSGNPWDISGGGNTKVPHLVFGNRPQKIHFTDECELVTNVSGSTITKGSPVKIVYSGVEPLQNNNYLFYGIALENISSGNSGYIKRSGYITNADLGINFTDSTKYTISSGSFVATSDLDYVMVSVNYLFARLNK